MNPGDDLGLCLAKWLSPFGDSNEFTFLLGDVVFVLADNKCLLSEISRQEVEKIVRREVRKVSPFANETVEIVAIGQSNKVKDSFDEYHITVTNLA